MATLIALLLMLNSLCETINTKDYVNSSKINNTFVNNNSVYYNNNNNNKTIDNNTEIFFQELETKKISRKQFVNLSYFKRNFTNDDFIYKDDENTTFAEVFGFYPKSRIKRSAPENGFRVSSIEAWPTSRIMNLDIICDRSCFGFNSKSRRRVRESVENIINYVNVATRELGIVIMISHIIIWDDRDDTVIKPDIKSTLLNLQSYRARTTSPKLIKSDHTLLLTRQRFRNAIGQATVDGMCGLQYSCSVVRMTNENPATTAVSVTHELGHNLGMTHDDEECKCKASDDRCIMRESNEQGAELLWSSCSLKQYTKKLGYFACLKKVTSLYPEQSMKYSVCGNNIIERSEQCDCGPEDMCENPCCDPKTCKFVSHASCASGKCCDLKTCTPKPAGIECRPTSSECDLPEFCTGSSEYCPADVTKLNGLPCDKNQGYCYRGECGSRRQQCKFLFGKGSTVASTPCYKDTFTKDSFLFNCGIAYNERKGTLEGKSCARRSVECGTLLCTSENPKHPSKLKENKLEHWTFMDTVKTCYFFFSSDSSPSILAADGSICNENQMCVDQTCTSVPAVPQHCSCAGRGVCNSNEHCHCNLGYDGSSNCTSPGFGGSIDSGFVVNPAYKYDFEKHVFYFFLVAVPVIVLIFCIRANIADWWERNGRRSVSAHSTRIVVCIDYCCCPFMSKINRCFAKAIPIGRKAPEPKRPTSTGIPSSVGSEVKIDINVASIDNQVSSWGVAKDTLITDIVRVTPSNSPTLKRKVRGTSESPVTIRKNYFQDHSTDDRLSTNTNNLTAVSFGSLISVFRKFTSSSSKRKSTTSQVSRLSIQEVSSEAQFFDRCRGLAVRGRSVEPEEIQPIKSKIKTVPLSRIVNDPKLNRQLSSEEQRQPAFKHYARSLSSESSHNNVPVRPSPPIPIIKISDSQDKDRKPAQIKNTPRQQSHNYKAILPPNKKSSSDSNSGSKIAMLKNQLQNTSVSQTSTNLENPNLLQKRNVKDIVNQINKNN